MRHLLGGRHDEVNKALFGRGCYNCISGLNRHQHEVGVVQPVLGRFFDVYVRLCSMGSGATGDFF